MNMPPSHSGTYFVNDMYMDEEVIRLSRLDRRATLAMGGLLAEQPQPGAFQRILDIACGVGHWAIDMAQAFPNVSLVGIDSQPRMIAAANEEAAALNLQERARFSIMDALQGLPFADFSFDLINIRFALGFVRYWEWQQLVGHIWRILRPGGVLRITEEKMQLDSNSVAEMQFRRLFFQALATSGHLPSVEDQGEDSELYVQLVKELNRQGFRNVCVQEHAIQIQGGTQAARDHIEDSVSLLHILRPFFLHWIPLPENYNDLQGELQADAQRSDYAALWQLVTLWGIRSEA